jgi:geranylgeranyl transferase type-2 subunit alpha
LLICIHPISGFEALQLLVALNLSHNQINSFTALEPVKYLKSLKVLDLSFNEIGSHPVDTTRYLCSSPLSHTYDVAETINEISREKIQIGDYWEAVLLFKSLQLVQLDMQGNPVSDEKFRVLVDKVIPCLRWLVRWKVCPLMFCSEDIFVGILVLDFAAAFCLELNL